MLASAADQRIAGLSFVFFYAEQVAQRAGVTDYEPAFVDFVAASNRGEGDRFLADRNRENDYFLTDEADLYHDETRWI